MHVYLLGAGASRDALPIVKEFPKRLMDFANQLENYSPSLDNILSAQFKSNRQPVVIRNDLIQQTRWLADTSRRHASIDTFAKKLFITKDFEKLLNLKSTLACYLFFEQANKPVDMRYDAFFASIISLSSGSLTLPQNIKILTWNYDSQIEKAFYEYWGGSMNLEATLQTLPRSPTNTSNQNPTNNEFCVLHLNGRAGLNLNNNNLVGKQRNIYDIDDRTAATVEILKMYDAYTAKPQSSLYPLWDFAWDENLTAVRELAKDVSSKATNLIVIGYSFPFFNREVDSEILGAMVDVENVYVQVPAEDFSGIETRIKSIAPHFKTIKHIAGLDQFYIPHH